MSFSKLSEPLELKHTQLRNRVIMGSMHTGLEDDPKHIDRLVEFYRQRAAGGVGLIVTGGYAPNRAGWLIPFGSMLTSTRDIQNHRKITDAVHKEGGKILLQILHAGRYAFHPFALAPSRIKSPISKFTPWSMPRFLIKKTIKDFTRCADLAKQAGYDGVEIMGSEGYLINQFIAERTNRRTDEWGGSFEKRCRFPIEIVKKTREKVGSDFIIMYRLSMLDLVDGGNSWDETTYLAKQIEKAGADLLNTGIGWHEARIPTIATTVPRGMFSFVTEKMRDNVQIPIVATNRINSPAEAENILQKGSADLISMARPMLADPNFTHKAFHNQDHEINTCIGCNQACLDRTFKGQTASCLVNPAACHESEYLIQKTLKPQNIAVVGAGPAGLSAAVTAAQRGHQVTIYEERSQIGGQFTIASRIPGKQEFTETMRYFQAQIDKHNIQVYLSRTAQAEELNSFDHIILATGIKPFIPEIPGHDHEKTLNYIDVLEKNTPVGNTVAIIGGGGIAFDTATYLTSNGPETIESFAKEWGIDLTLRERGGLCKAQPHVNRSITMLQRREGKMGARLGKTTGWIHRTLLKHRGVQMIAGVTYDKIDDQGLHYTLHGKSHCLQVDHVILCTGQRPRLDLQQRLTAPHTLIGGAKKANELDAERAIREGTQLAMSL
ncbi:MAG: FAD-dependent oxidoreductase [Oligoflexales bacterium]